MKTRANHLATIFASIAITFSSLVLAQDNAPKQTLFTNVQIFDGVSEERMAGNVLVEGDLIKRISAEPISASDATVIDGGGRTLTPGFVDAHTHIALIAPFDQLENEYTGVYVGAAGGK